MENTKISLTDFIATLEFKGINNMKQNLKEVEKSLDRILSKYEKAAALGFVLQEQPKVVNIKIPNFVNYFDLKNSVCSQEKNL